MKRFVVAAMMVTSPALAKDSVLSCFAKSNNEQVTIVGSGSDAKIQWNGGPFNYGTATLEEDRYLIIKQFGNTGTFRMVYDAISGTAYGGTIFYNGRKWESAFACSWQ